MLNILKHSLFGLIIGLSNLALSADGSAKQLLTIYANFPEELPRWQEQVPGEDVAPLNLTHPPFIAMNPDWLWACRVCKEIPSTTKVISKSEKNAVHYVSGPWEIRGDYYWENGKPVTGLDVKATINSLKTKLPVLGQIFRKVIVDQDDPRKFSLVLSSNWRHFSQSLALRLIPPLKAPMLSYGPWRIESWQKDKIDLSPNPHFKGAKPEFGAVRFLSAEKTPETASPFVALPSLRQWLLGPWLPALEAKRKTSEVIIHELVGTALDAIVLNLRNPLFSDLRVRQALSLALDRAELNEQIYHGKGWPTVSFGHPSDQMCPLNDRPSLNLARAQELLTEAGWILNEEGQRAKKNGEILRINLTYPDDPIKSQAFRIIARQWGILGIQIKADPAPSAIYSEEFLSKAKFTDAALMTWQTVPGIFPYEVFSSKEIPSRSNDYRGKNIAGWANKQVDHILRRYENSDSSKSYELCRELMVQFVQELPILPILFEPTIVASSIDFVGLEPTMHQYSSLLYSNDWRQSSR